MKIKLASVAVSVLLNTFGSAALAGQPAPQTMTTVNIAGTEVPVVAGGMYDRFRSNPPLSVVEKESPSTDLSWFKTLTKTKRDIGFESYSPNFYYENSKITIVYTADIDKLRALIPAKVLDEVQPLQVWPGRGLVALTAYAYHYCDNDSYNEIALSVVTNKPGEGNSGPLSLVSQTLDKNMWGYVFKLPVDTDLAKVRGVVGYNLPKWKTRIDYRQTDSKLVFEVADAKTGKTDFVIQAERLKDVSKDISLSTQSFTNLSHDGQLTTGYSVSRQQVHGSSFSQDSVDLKLSDGSFSSFIKSLDLGRMVQYQYVPNFQMALYAPELLKKPSVQK
jgi:hypothetical protein